MILCVVHQLIAESIVSWNFTYLIFFAPEEFQDVETSTATASRHLHLLILLYFILFKQLLNRHESYVLTIQRHTAKYAQLNTLCTNLTTNDSGLRDSERPIPTYMQKGGKFLYYMLCRHIGHRLLLVVLRYLWISLCTDNTYVSQQKVNLVRGHFSVCTAIWGLQRPPNTTDFTLGADDLLRRPLC